jgi:hypothetical protein
MSMIPEAPAQFNERMAPFVQTRPASASEIFRSPPKTTSQLSMGLVSESESSTCTVRSMAEDSISTPAENNSKESEQSLCMLLTFSMSQSFDDEEDEDSSESSLQDPFELCHSKAFQETSSPQGVILRFETRIGVQGGSNPHIPPTNSQIIADTWRRSSQENNKFF